MARRKAAGPGALAGTATTWLEKIDSAINTREKDWRTKGKKVVQRYRDERDKSGSYLTSRVNILWSNTEVLKAAIYARTAQPDVRRRFSETRIDNALARIIAEILERTLSYIVDQEDVDSPIGSAIDDMLLPGRGVCRVSYEPEIEEAAYEQPAGDEAADQEQSYGVENTEQLPDGRIVSQKLCLDYVYWEDYCQGVARQDKDVPWKAYRFVKRRSEIEARWPDIVSKRTIDTYVLKDVSGSTISDGDDTDDPLCEGWEVWDKSKRERLYVIRGYADVAQTDPDPYRLSCFYPSPRPLYSVTTTDRNTPQPEFIQYQDQANAIDRAETRIEKLVEGMRVRGIYDATLPDNAAPGGSTLADVAKADDNEFLPHHHFQTIRDRGGIEAAFGFFPIEKHVVVIERLEQRKARLVQGIYEITGISDIVRGATDPNETKGAQVLKAQFGSMRMQRRQRDLQRFIKDLYRILAEIVAEHFTQETLAQITGVDLPTAEEQAQIKAQLAMQAAQAQQPPGPDGQPMPPEPPEPEMMQRAEGPNWDDVLRILRSDKLRSYRVDVETDATALVDEQAEKASRIEFLTAIQGLLEKAAMAAAQAPQTIPLIKELTVFAMRTFKAGRNMEEAVEDTFDELQKNPPSAPPGEEPEAPPMPDKGSEMRGEAAVAEVKRKGLRDKADVVLALRKERREDEEAEASAGSDAREQDREDAALADTVRQGQVGNLMKAADMKQRRQSDQERLRANALKPFMKPSMPSSAR